VSSHIHLIDSFESFIVESNPIADQICDIQGCYGYFGIEGIHLRYQSNEKEDYAIKELLGKK
jgi:hypothetical protein